MICWWMCACVCFFWLVGFIFQFVLMVSSFLFFATRSLLLSISCFGFIIQFMSMFRFVWFGLVYDRIVTDQVTQAHLCDYMCILCILC